MPVAEKKGDSVGWPAMNDGSVQSSLRLMLRSEIWGGRMLPQTVKRSIR